MSGDQPIPEDLLKRIGTVSGRRLFVPIHFDFADEAGLLELIDQHPLAQLVSADGDDLRATAAALIHDGGRNPREPAQPIGLMGHLAQRNPHAALVRRGARAVAIFQGPNAYISPRWSRESPSLPTWSYVAVQARGVFEPIDDLAGTREVLERTITRMERAAERPWRLEDATPELVDTLIRHIVAFRFRVDDLQGIKRLNQNRRDADRLGIIDGLREGGADGALQIAALMELECCRRPD
jgi:transcriptional regulator